MTDEFELDLSLAALNQQLLRKLWWCWVVAIALFFLSLLFNDFAFAIATWTAEYIPSIEKLLQPGMAGKYFGVLVCFLPIFVLAIVWREDIRIRFLSTAKKPGKSILKNFIGVYFLFIPLVIFFLAVFLRCTFRHADCAKACRTACVAFHDSNLSRLITLWQRFRNVDCHLHCTSYWVFMAAIFNGNTLFFK